MARVLFIKSERLTQREHWLVSPLGPYALAALAREHGHEAEVLDLRVVPAHEVKKTLDDTIARGFDFIGLSALSIHLTHLARVANYIREAFPKVLMIAGGPGPTSDTEWTLRNTGVDACALNEGEKTFLELARRVHERRDWHDTPGLAYLGAGAEIIKTRDPGLWENMDELPYAAWDMHDFDRYGQFLSMSMRLGRRAELQTQRGCMFHCTYCHSFMGKAVRSRSPEHVLRELKMLRHRYGVRRFEIVDDIFNAHRARSKAILRMVRDELPDVELTFPNGIRVDILDEEMIRLMAEANTAYLVIAVESASPRIQKLARKHLNLEKMRRNLDLLKHHGIYTAAFFMVGFPTETPDEIDATFDLAATLPIDLPMVSVVKPFRGTEMWNALDDGFRAQATPENLDAQLGYANRGFSPFRSDELLARAERVAMKHLIRPQNWFIGWNELRWGKMRPLQAKIVQRLPPSAWRERLQRRIEDSYLDEHLDIPAWNAPLPWPAAA